MLRVQDRNQLLDMFREIDKDNVVITKDLKFPIAVTDYFAWREPSGHRTFLIIEDRFQSRHFAIALDRTKSPEKVPMMCNWCHSVRPSKDVALMTISVTRRKRVGIHLCSDISCKENILERPSVNDMRETIDRQEKIVRLNQKVQNFINHEIL